MSTRRKAEHLHDERRCSVSRHLTVQQRGFLAEADKHVWVSARMFAGATKPRSAGTFYPLVTLNSAQAVLRRLSRRDLLAQDAVNPAIFRITDTGRKALASSGDAA